MNKKIYFTPLAECLEEKLWTGALCASLEGETDDYVVDPDDINF